jgi:hypothetical protein
MIRRAVSVLTCSTVLLLGLQCLAIENGEQAPKFKATGVDGKEYSLDGVSKGAKAQRSEIHRNQC